jgi:hypothetical protein
MKKAAGASAGGLSSLGTTPPHQSGESGSVPYFMRIISFVSLSPAASRR